jgi:D-glycero-D-manno-heptose 1,7-bisphosphate phosphatase
VKVIFLDRDGVINKEEGYIHKPSSFKFIDGIFQACRYFQSNGFQIIIITNQSGISRGYYSENDFMILTDWMLKQFLINDIKILDVLHCPHGPKSNCNCRKPKPGMPLKAQSLYNIDMQYSWMIGDKEEDIKAASDAGINNTILVKSGHTIDEQNSNAKYILKSIYECIEIIK